MSITDTKTVILQGHNNRPDGTRDGFWAREVPAKDAPMRHHSAGLTWTASGYGEAIPSRLMVKFRGRWRRVYVRIFSNVGTAYIKTGPEETITVQD